MNRVALAAPYVLVEVVAAGQPGEHAVDLDPCRRFVKHRHLCRASSCAVGSVSRRNVPCQPMAMAMGAPRVNTNRDRVRHHARD